MKKKTHSSHVISELPLILYICWCFACARCKLGFFQFHFIYPRRHEATHIYCIIFSIASRAHTLRTLIVEITTASCDFYQLAYN